MPLSLYEFENRCIESGFCCKNYLFKSDTHEKALYENPSGEKMIRTFIRKPADISVYKTLVNISCKNLCTIFEVSECDDGYVIFEEYCDGMTLSEMLEDGSFSLRDSISCAMQICCGLYALHKNNIIHRDIKPDNIIMLNDNTVKIIDFNIAKLYKVNKDGDTSILGTVGYAAPEQYGIAQTDFRSDIFSLGVLLNYMITGSHPSVRLCENKYIADILRRCLSINPADRFASADRLYHALEKAKRAVKA